MNDQELQETLEVQNEVQQPESPTTDTAVEDTADQHEAPAEDPREKNWKAMREKLAQIERERDEARYIADEYRRSAQPKQPEPQEEEEEDDFRISDDDVAEGKHISYLNKQLKALRKEQKAFKKEQEAFRQETYQTTTETRLKARFNDFDQVVNSDNIARLKQEYPELAKSLNETKDLYAKAVSAYTMIQKLLPQDEHAMEAREKLAANRNKPRSTASVAPQHGDTPLSQANRFARGLTPELKEQLYNEMKAAQRNR